MNEIETIITADPTGSKLVEFACLKAKGLVLNQLTRTQIRNIFTEVRKIEALWDSDPNGAMLRLNMLKPKLDYQTSRHSSVSGLRDILIPAIDEVNKAPDTKTRDQRFERFMDLFEAILAYHRAFGGKN